MPRLSHALRLLALLVPALAVLGLPARAEEEGDPKPSVSFADDLDAKTQRELTEVASAYLDPEVEFLWRPRKEFIAALENLQAEHGVNALVDIPLLREIVYQGRHFLPRFSDRKWQRENDITDFKTEKPYMHVVSERFRFSYALPKGYPKERAFSRPGRPEPFPLLLSIHEERDTKDAKMQAQKYPGGAALKRRYPKREKAFESLYEEWMLVAPVAARAKFLEDGAIRHRYLTSVLTNFWRRYHVDFDRIIVDGAEPAAALAAAFPQVFAGIVLRPGDEMAFDPEVVRNYATVPVFVVGDEKLGKQLEEAGHPQVTVGTDAELLPWMNERRRKTPKSFRWAVRRPDQVNANWVVVTGPDYLAPERTLEVEALDTEADPNTIKIDARGVEHLEIFLNDEIVDLDRDVRLLVNGEEKVYAKAERDFGRLFEKDPEVRRNMNFGWLFTRLIQDVRVPAPAAETPPEEGPTEPTPPEEGPKGDPADEARAATLWEKAGTLEEEGDTARAKTYYEKIVEIGETSYLARAKAKIEELK